MSPSPAPTPGRRAVSPLDHHLEAVTGYDVDTLWAYRDRGALDEQHTHLVDMHRELATAETDVIFYLRLLNRLSSGEFDVDSALFTRIDRTVQQLDEAASTRDAIASKVLAALEPIEAAAEASARDTKRLSTNDQAALLTIAGGAKLYEHLLSGQVSVTAASGIRIPHAELERLENAGLVVRDTGHPVSAGQPVTLTDAGRAVLFAARRVSAARAAKLPPGPGTSSSALPHRR